MKLLITLTLISAALAPLAQAEGNPTPVKKVVVNGQSILADRHELTAYVFDVDAADSSNCYNGCAKTWPPILLKDGETTAAPFGETKRKDGTRQITFQHRPIYLFVGDQGPRETKGDGLNGVWHIIPQ